MKNISVEKVDLNRVEEIYSVLLQCSDETNFLACDSRERLKRVPLGTFRGFLESSAATDNEFFLCLYDNKVIGMLGLHSENRERFSHRISLGMNILKDYWGQGGGHLLLKAAIDYFHSKKHLTKLELEVRTDNLSAVNLYKKLGFEIEGEVKNHFCIDSVYYSVYRMAIIKNSL